MDISSGPEWGVMGGRVRAHIEALLLLRGEKAPGPFLIDESDSRGRGFRARLKAEYKGLDTRRGDIAGLTKYVVCHLDIASCFGKQLCICSDDHDLFRLGVHFLALACAEIDFAETIF